MLVPMLQVPHMHSPVLTAGGQIEHFDTLAQVVVRLAVVIQKTPPFLR